MIHAGYVSKFLTEQFTERQELLRSIGRGTLIAGAVTTLALTVIVGSAMAAYVYSSEEGSEAAQNRALKVSITTGLTVVSLVAVGVLFGAEGIIVGTLVSTAALAVGRRAALAQATID